MSIRSDIAEAVKDELNLGVTAGAFGVWQFAARRLNVPLFDLADLKNVHVTVVGRSYEEETVSRADTRADLDIDVAVQKKVASVEPAEIDPLADLVEAVIAYFRNRRLTGCPEASWRATKNEMPYIPEHLDEKRLFTSVITLSYRLLA